MLKSSDRLLLDCRSLERIEAGVDQRQVARQKVEWEPARTAAVICDLWDRHWCKSATARLTEMAPRVNIVISQLRQRGVLIIHCPSDTMDFYEGTPGRKLAQLAPHAESEFPVLNQYKLNGKVEPSLPIDNSDGGCDDEPPCRGRRTWRRQIDSIEIKEGDAITDNSEAYNLMRQRGITNVIVMGAHLNRCILARPFAIRHMVARGQNVVLLRDLADSLYNSRRQPYVDHFTANDLMIWHIEKYWCPSITSDQIIGGTPFRFAADTRSRPTVMERELSQRGWFIEPLVIDRKPERPAGKWKKLSKFLKRF